MNTIIALRGKGNSGKSTTMRNLRLFLIDNKYELISSKPDNRGDFVAIFLKNGILVGVTSYGDTYDVLQLRLRELIESSCTICVCVCRTFDRVVPGTNAALHEVQGFSVQYIDKTFEAIEPFREIVNENDVRRLFTSLERLRITTHSFIVRYQNLKTNKNECD